MSVKSRVMTMKVSKQEMFYVSRSLFNRNKQFMKNQQSYQWNMMGMEGNEDERTINRSRADSRENQAKPLHLLQAEELNTKNFETFFMNSRKGSSAGIANSDVSENFGSTDLRATTASSSIRGVSQRRHSSAKSQYPFVKQFDDFQATDVSVNMSNKKISDESGKKSQKSQYFLRKRQMSVQTDLQYQIAAFENQKAQKVQEAEDRQNGDEQWKGLRSRAPHYSFYLNSPKKSIFEPSPHTLDDESRYNNFFINSPDQTHSPDMRKKTWRNYQVFSLDHLNDLHYPISYKQHDKVIYDSRNMKCNFDLSRQHEDPNQVGRNFYNKQHKDDIPVTILNSDKIISARNNILPFRKNVIPAFHVISARERPSSIPFCLLKSNENPYLHEKYVQVRKRKSRPSISD